MTAAAVRQRSRPAPEAKKEKQEKAPASGLAKVMEETAKAYGPNIFRRAADKPRFRHLPTGIFLLDMALLGGVPEGLATQIFGWESSGKTTTAMRVVGAAQQKYPSLQPVFFDFEGTFDPAWATKHGVDVDKLWLSQPASGEQGLDVLDAVIRAGDTSLVVVDSLPAIIPAKELEGAMEDVTVGLQSRLIGKFLRKMTNGLIEESKRGHFPAILFINQWRLKIVQGGKGDPKQLAGGNALRYLHSVGIEIFSKPNNEGRDANGNQVFSHNEHGFRIKKSKLGNSIPEGEFTMIRNPDHPLGAGWIDDAETVVTFGRRFGFITGEGSQPKRVDGIDETFGKLSEIRDYFYSDLEFFERFKARLITEQRRKMGLIPDGWYK